MADVIVMTYLLGWPLAGVILAVVSRLLQNRLRPHLLAASLLAGAVWPLLLLGVGQFVGVVAIAKALAEDEAGPAAVAADELVSSSTTAS